MNPRRSAEEVYRPPCMQRLGLLPPYSVADVKRAYRELAKKTHPDAGGDAAEFASLHENYERALNLAGFHESRRSWLAERVDVYLGRVRLMDHIAAHGGRCLLQRPDHYLADFGPDFAHVLCELTAVYLTECPTADAVLAQFPHEPAAREIRLLDVSFSRVTDAGVRHLTGLSLYGLDARSTGLTARCLPVIAKLPNLEWLHLGQTRIGFWSRFRLRRKFPELEIAMEADIGQPDFDSLQYRQSDLMQRLAEQQLP